MLILLPAGRNRVLKATCRYRNDAYEALFCCHGAAFMMVGTDVELMCVFLLSYRSSFIVVQIFDTVSEIFNVSDVFFLFKVSDVPLAAFLHPYSDR